MTDSTKNPQQKDAPQQKEAQKKKQVQKDAEVLKLLQEDQDDFQQFQQDAYDNKNVPTKIDPKQWRQDWDDEDINDEFTSQLRNELKA